MFGGLVILYALTDKQLKQLWLMCEDNILNYSI